MSSLFASEAKEKSQSLFQRLRPACTAILQNAVLTPTSIPIVSRQLIELLHSLQDYHTNSGELSPSLVSYIFFPLSSLLRRNDSNDIPSRAMEGIWKILEILGHSWWWTCDLQIWDQLLVLASTIIADSTANETKSWDDATKAAVVSCCVTLLRSREGSGDSNRFDHTDGDALDRFKLLQQRGQSPQMMPILGRLLNECLLLCTSSDGDLQNCSLALTSVIVRSYISDDMAPAVLPGVASTAAKVALGSHRPGWSVGKTAAEGLTILRTIVLKSFDDHICVHQGVVARSDTLEDLASRHDHDLEKSPNPTASRPVPRTPKWLRASASQIHIILNSLITLTRHPSHFALSALASLSYDILAQTRLTLPNSQPTLVTILLGISTTHSLTVSAAAYESLVTLLQDSRGTGFAISQTLKLLSREYLISLPTTLRRRDDARTESLARELSVICKLAGDARTPISVSEEISSFLGPAGGIEKWGWNVVSVLEIKLPPGSVHFSSLLESQLLTGPPLETPNPFPEVVVNNVSSREARQAVIQLFRMFGHAGGVQALYSVDWFLKLGLNGPRRCRAEALWCCENLLEGIMNISLDSQASRSITTLHSVVENMARSFAKDIAEIWKETSHDTEPANLDLPGPTVVEDSYPDTPELLVEHSKGLQKLETRFDAFKRQPPSSKFESGENQLLLQRALLLHLLTILSAILGSKYPPLFLFTLYPMLHSIASTNEFLSNTGLAALQHTASNCAYASSANCLLSNFDYALDGVSQRLKRQHLDIDAAKVMAMLVSLVGKDIVERAGDVVEECFDRLDDFHGYGILVESLIDVLKRVIEVLESGTIESQSQARMSRSRNRLRSMGTFHTLSEWFQLQSMDSTTDVPSMDPTDTKEAEHPARNEECEIPRSTSIILAEQITKRCIPLLTHRSALIRASILSILTSAVPILPSSVLLPLLHPAWPYVLKRLEDTEPFVVNAAAGYIATLSGLVGDFMATRMWKDVWPKFKLLVDRLDTNDSMSSLHRKTVPTTVFSEFTTSHRIFASILHTLREASEGTTVPHEALWEVTLTFRRLLAESVHPELQRLAIELYISLKHVSEDAVWLALRATCLQENEQNSAIFGNSLTFLQRPWKISQNVEIILAQQC